jgi:hypothetical protein
MRVLVWRSLQMALLLLVFLVKVLYLRGLFEKKRGA